MSSDGNEQRTGWAAVAEDHVDPTGTPRRRVVTSAVHMILVAQLET
jgi:hypothetical protein